MDERRVEWDSLNIQGTEQPGLKIDSWEPIECEIGPAEATEKVLEGASLGSGECSLPRRPVVGEQLDGPTGRAVDGGVVLIQGVPAVVGEENENDLELHPLWQLLELAGYEL